ncbi:MAG: OmpH family outer membrane protein [Phycisphaerales bacterium]|nr:OmpH family outer membrane protein [Phycisphaerales bacterium]
MRRLSPIHFLSFAVVVAALYAAVAPDRPAVIACVDLEKIYNGLDSLKAAIARQEEIRSGLMARVEAAKEELVGLQDELDSFRPGTDAYTDASKRAVEKAGELNALQGFVQLKMESERANATREAYTSIKTASATIGAQLKIDVIFIDDTIPAIEPADFQGTLSQINGRRMLYSNTALDVTDLVIQQANADFKSTRAP